ncbi:hypothetical protein ACFYU8_27870 [Brevibacillus sp. NPDC003359]|uniref:hypothetical protein n=1 Tax=unclassified Brevibacillus TaxID=2684853 RepID=UPI00368808EB
MNTIANPTGIFINALQNFLGNDPVMIVSSIGIVWLVIWLFKEIGKNIHQGEQNNLNTLEKRINAYGKLEVAIVRYLQERGGEKEELEKELFDVFSNSYLEISYSLHQRISKFMTSLSNDQLEKSLDLIRKELDQFKLKQAMLVKNPIKDSIFDMIEFPGKLFAKVFKPAFIIFIYIIVGSVILLIGWDIKAQSNPFSVILIILNTLAIISSFFIIIGIVDIISEKRFRHSFTNWSFVISYLLLSIACLNWYYWFNGLIIVVLTVIFTLRIIPRLLVVREE